MPLTVNFLVNSPLPRILLPDFSRFNNSWFYKYHWSLLQHQIIKDVQLVKVNNRMLFSVSVSNPRFWNDGTMSCHLQNRKAYSPLRNFFWPFDPRPDVFTVTWWSTTTNTVYQSFTNAGFNSWSFHYIFSSFVNASADKRKVVFSSYQLRLYWVI